MSLFNPFTAHGQYYSANEIKKEISVDKKLRSIGDTQYFDNIEALKKTFFENDVVEFQVKIENIGNETVSNIKVKDTLPKYLALIFYPGILNKDTNVIEWSIDKLEAGQSKNYLIRAKINGSAQIANTTKQTNNAKVTVDELTDSDNASYFIGSSTVPATGVSGLAIQTALVAATGLSGFYFRKLARGY